MTQLPFLFCAFSVLTGFTGSVFAALTWESRSADVAARIDQTEISAEYRFTNAGTTPITITSVYSPCPCISAPLSKTQYAPGETGVLTVRFQLGDRTGQSHQIIKVETDDPTQPQTVLSLDVQIPQVWTMPQRFINWTIGEALSSKEVMIGISGDEPLKLVDAVVLDGPMKAVLREDEPGRRYTILITPTDTSKRTLVRIQLKPQRPELRPPPLIYASVIGKN